MLLIAIEVGVVVDNVLMRGQQKPAGAAGRIADRHARLRTHDLDNRPNQGPWREVLSCACLHVLGVLLQQSLVGVALDVHVERHPLLTVDQVHDQPTQLRRVLDAEHPRLASELGQDVAIVDLQAVTIQRQQARPVEALGDERRPLERRPRLLVGHLQEQQIRELLDVVTVGEAIVTQDAAVAPQALDEAV
jgi:hypothetical protein